MKTKNLGLFIALISFAIITIGWKQCVKERQKRVKYKGVLIDIYNDEENRGTTTYKIKVSNTVVKENVSVYPDSFSYVEIGDSIIKEEGTLQIIVKKKKMNFNTYAIFDFQN